MKRLSFLIFLLLSLPFISFATEGTCSWHGGINCSAGADWDGSAICNDGWRDSTESFYSAQMCSSYRHSCTTEERQQFDLKYEAPQKQGIYDGYWAQLQPYMNKTTSGDISDRRETLIIVLDLTAKAEKARTDWMSAMNQSDRDCYALGEKHYYEQMAEFLRQEYSQPQSVPTYFCPANSTLNANNRCSCDYGYANYKNQCVTVDDYCKLTLGFNSTTRIIEGAYRCACDTGYVWNSSKSTCDKIVVQTLPQPTPVSVSWPKPVATSPKNVILPKQQVAPIAEDKKVQKQEEQKKVISESTTTSELFSQAVQKESPKQQTRSWWQKMISPFRNIWGWLLK